jgi:hypothetical protein
MDLGGGGDAATTAGLETGATLAVLRTLTTEAVRARRLGVR